MRFRAALMLVFACAVLASAAGMDMRATRGARVTADEPQYLLTAISLWEDRSLDISDEIQARRFLPFHEISLNRQTEPQPDGSEISPHDPLLPLLLAAPVAVGGWEGAKWFMALINGLLAASILWIAVKRFNTPVWQSAAIVAVFGASGPLAVYGTQIYPEIVAALCVTVAVAALTGPMRRAGVVAATASVVALPWLSVKYAPVAAVVAVFLVLRVRKQNDMRSVWGLIAVLCAAGVAFVAAHLAWYGGLTPYGTGDHFVTSGEFSVVGTNVDLVGRSRRIIGLLFDDKFGIAVWQPAYFIALPAVGALWRIRPAGWQLLVSLWVCGWLNATFVALTMQGWWWPGRQLVIILPVLVLMTIWWAARALSRSVAVIGLGAAGVVSYLWLVRDGLQQRVTWVVDFFETRAIPYRFLSSVTPDYLEVTTRTWVLHVLWGIVAAVAIVLGYKTAEKTVSG